MSGAANYLVWSNEHRAWWAPNRCGYFTDIAKAGRYSRDEAIAIASAARGGWAKGKNPPEIAIPEQDAIEQALAPNRLEAWCDIDPARLMDARRADWQRQLDEDDMGGGAYG